MPCDGFIMMPAGDHKWERQRNRERDRERERERERKVKKEKESESTGIQSLFPTYYFENVLALNLFVSMITSSFISFS